MNFLEKLALYLLLSIALCTPLFAQVVDIPDPNLRAAIADALNIAHDAPITQEDMNRLTDLIDVRHRGIANLAGLEFATNLYFLRIADNPTIDLSPIANLTQLERLILWSIPQLDISPLANLTTLRDLTIAHCDIVNISPLGTLTQLTNLYIGYNRIIDITPLTSLPNLAALGLNRNQIIDVTALANLTQLTELHLKGNRIEDFSPLAHLTRLESLDIRGNRGTDVSPLDGLALTEFLYDESCEHVPFPVRDRIENRNYPSIFARWSGPSWPPIVNRPELTGIENQASHDLWFSVPMFDLRFEYWPEEIRVVGNLDEAIRQREELLAINPNMVFLVQVRMRSGTEGYLPEDSPYWIRDAEGNIVEGDLMDFTHPYIQDRIVKQAIAVSKCGLYDGIMFDWWNEHGAVLADDLGDWSHKFRGNETEQRARDNILRRIRAATRPDFLILGNTEYITPPSRTGPHLNGGFMERPVPRILSRADIEEVLAAVENALIWKEQNMREPQIIALEGEAVRTEPPDSPTNLRWMRAITTLSLTHSDGYVLFTGTGIPKDYRHYWFDFWDADLGRPVGSKAQLYDEQIPGLYIREFTNGWAVYNHSGEPQVIALPEETQGVASGLVNTEHALANLDGERYLRVKPKNPADVNGDGVVNILDLTIVDQGFGTDNPEADVNADGVVNVFDLVVVANQF